MKKKKGKLIFSIVYAVLLAGTLGMYIYGYHGFHIAEGVGLWGVLTFGFGATDMFLMISDIIRFVILTALIVVPLFINGEVNMRNTFAFLSMFLALRPEISTGWMLHLFDGGYIKTRISDVFSDNLWLSNVSEPMMTVKVLIPLAFFAMLAVNKERKEVFKNNKIRILVAAVSLVLSIVFPGFFPLLMFVSIYCVLLCVIEPVINIEMENGWGVAIWNAIIVVFWLAGIYRLYMLMCTY